MNLHQDKEVYNICLIKDGISVSFVLDNAVISFNLDKSTICVDDESPQNSECV